LKKFFENHRGSGKFIDHRVAARFFYKPSRRGSGAAAAVLQPRWTSLFLMDVKEQISPVGDRSDN
jgi:hypothetical protein